MFSIIEHIEYLITSHDCVIVPDWGAFIANYDSACYNSDSKVYVRPQRTIGFNASIVHNDYLLMQSIMRREHIDSDEARKFIVDSVATFRQQLSMGCEVSMGRLGFFRRQTGQQIEFVPFVHTIASDKYYGLADVSIKSVEILETELSQENEAAPKTIIGDRRKNLFSRKATQIAASVVALLGLGIMLSTPIIVDRSDLDMASMAPTITAPQPQQLGPTVENTATGQTIEKIESHPAIASVGNTSGKYYMVIATLRNQQELDAFKSKYSSLVPYMKMLDYKGMTCVYVARSDDYAQLMSLSNELPERLRDVWIYN